MSAPPTSRKIPVGVIYAGVVNFAQLVGVLTRRQALFLHDVSRSLDDLAIDARA